MYKYFELKQEAGKYFVLANEKEKPTREEYFDSGFSLEFNEQHFDIAIMQEWQSNHVRIEFASKEDGINILNYVERDYADCYKQHKLLSDLKQGIPIECVYIGCKSKSITDNNELGSGMIELAYFKSPEKPSAQPKERLYTEEEMK